MTAPDASTYTVAVALMLVASIIFIYKDRCISTCLLLVGTAFLGLSFFAPRIGGFLMNHEASVETINVYTQVTLWAFSLAPVFVSCGMLGIAWRYVKKAN